MQSATQQILRDALPIPRSLLPYPKGYWETEEVNGNRADGTGLVTLTETAPNVNQAAGKVGNAALFVAPGGPHLASANSPYGSTLPAQDFTFCGWVYPTGTPGSFGTGNIYCGMFQIPGVRWALNSVLTPWSTLSIATYPYTLLLHAGNAVTLNAWNFVIFRYNAVTRFYQARVNTNGWVKDRSAGNWNNGATTQPIRMGQGDAGYNYDTWPGRLDQIGVWLSRPNGGACLTDSDADWLYNSGNGRSYADITALQI